MLTEGEISISLVGADKHAAVPRCPNFTVIGSLPLLRRMRRLRDPTSISLTLVLARHRPAPEHQVRSSWRSPKQLYEVFLVGRLIYLALSDMATSHKPLWYARRWQYGVEGNSQRVRIPPFLDPRGWDWVVLPHHLHTFSDRRACLRIL